MSVWSVATVLSAKEHDEHRSWCRRSLASSWDCINHGTIGVRITNNQFISRYKWFFTSEEDYIMFKLTWS